MTETGSTDTPDETTSIAEILEARQTAGGGTVNVDQPTTKLVVFRLTNVLFAFPSSSVKEILADVQVSVLPGCPSSLEGVINVRGDIESVISLRHLLDFPPLDDKTRSRILLGRSKAMNSGIRVDEVMQILDVPLVDIQDAPSSLQGNLKGWVSGVLLLDEQSVMLLDMEQLLADYRIGS